MKQEINPQETNRAQAFELWMKSPMPMVTLSIMETMSNTPKATTTVLAMLPKGSIFQIRTITYVTAAKTAAKKMIIIALFMLLKGNSYAVLIVFVFVVVIEREPLCGSVFFVSIVFSIEREQLRCSSGYVFLIRCY